MSKKELEKSKELARLYYLNGDTQKLVAEKVGVSRVTINKWVSDGGWDTMRMAKSITRKELVTKMMQKANDKLEEGNMSFDEIANNSGSIIEMAKLSASIKELDKQTNAVTILEVLTAYNEWLVARMQVDKELTTDLVKTMNRYQDMFLSEQIGNNKSLFNGN